MLAPIRFLSVIAACVMVLPPAAMAQERKSGEQVYAAVCMACHAAGVDKAPKFGDRKAWAPLIKEGQAVLTSHAWVGIRGMPPKGGRPDLSLEEFSAAVVHMANAAGGKWKDPDAAMLARIRAEEKKRIDALAKKAAK